MQHFCIKRIQSVHLHSLPQLKVSRPPKPLLRRWTKSSRWSRNFLHSQSSLLPHLQDAPQISSPHTGWRVASKPSCSPALKDTITGPPRCSRMVLTFVTLIALSSGPRRLLVTEGPCLEKDVLEEEMSLRRFGAESEYINISLYSFEFTDSMTPLQRLLSLRG